MKKEEWTDSIAVSCVWDFYLMVSNFRPFTGNFGHEFEFFFETLPTHCCFHFSTDIDTDIIVIFVAKLSVLFGGKISVY